MLDFMCESDVHKLVRSSAENGIMTHKSVIPIRADETTAVINYIHRNMLKLERMRREMNINYIQIFPDYRQFIANIIL